MTKKKTKPVGKKKGKPALKPSSTAAESAELIGSLKGKIDIRGDIETTGLAWDAES